MTARSMVRCAGACLPVAMVFIFVGLAHAEFTTVWQLGAPGRAWPVDGVGSGPDVDFLQENGTINPLPGSPTSGTAPRSSDNDYYFAGTYNGPNSLNATVPTDETGFERAFAVADNDLRIHFNLPADLHPLNTFRFSFEANNLDERDLNPNPRYGIEVSFNGTVIFPELTITSAELNTVFTSDVFTAVDVGAGGGLCGDNIVSLRGINHNADGGGDWMGMDFHHLEREPIPEPSTLLLISLGGLLLLPVLKRRRMAKPA